MENRPLSVVAYLIVLLAMPFAVLAADGEVNSDQQTAWQARLDKAADLQSRGKALQAEADQMLVQKNTECATRFLINDCRNAAAREHLKVTRETRRLENEGNTIEREVKREQARELFASIAGLVIALEPMLNMGAKDVMVSEDQWTVRTRDGSLCCHFEHTIAIRDGQEVEILTLP